MDYFKQLLLIFLGRKCKINKSNRLILKLYQNIFYPKKFPELFMDNQRILVKGKIIFLRFNWIFRGNMNNRNNDS